VAVARQLDEQPTSFNMWRFSCSERLAGVWHAVAARSVGGKVFVAAPRNSFIASVST
jgi:hypothetical protein